MKIALYSLHDRCSGYDAPFSAHSDAEALRFLDLALKDPAPNRVNQCPEDFTLFRVGEMDTDTGVIFSSVQKLVRGGDLDV